MKRIFALLLTLALLASSGAALAAGGYTDVPDSHWAEGAIPSGYADAVKQLQANGCQLSLSVFMDNHGGALAAMLADTNGRSQAVQAILTEATRTYTDLGSSPYTGVTIDFEGLAGSTNQANFTAFLQALSQQLKARDLRLAVAVMPATADGLYYNVLSACQ